MDDSARQEFERLLEDKMSAREAARTLGISPSTGIAWAKKWRERSGTPTDGPVGADEQRVTDLLLSKAERLLDTLPALYTTKERLEQAKAIEALLGKYLSFVGKATEQHITVDGASSQELDKFLKQLLPENAPAE